MERPPLLPILGLLALIGVIILSEVLVRPETHPGRVEILYWEKWTNFEADAMRAVVDKYNKSQDKIFVKYLTISDIGNKTMMAIAGNIPPDVAGLYGNNVSSYAYNRAVLPLDDLAKEYNIKQDDYIPGFWDICTYNGKLWALPTTPASLALHYNKDLLTKGGWDANKPPETIEDLDALDSKVSRIDKGHIEVSGFLPQEPGWWNWAWPYYFGGQLWDGKSKITSDDPVSVQAYTWVGSFAKKYGLTSVQTFRSGFGQFDSPQNAFIEGKVASELQGVWMANFIGKYNSKLDWGAVPFPYPKDKPELKNSSVLDLDVLVIPRGAKHPKEAMDFIKFVQKQENMEMLCMLQKKATPLVKCSEEFLAKHPNPYIRLFRSMSLNKSYFITPKIPIWSEYSDEINKAMDDINSAEDEVRQGGSQATADQKIKEALGKVRERIQPRLDEVLRIDKEREAAGK